MRLLGWLLWALVMGVYDFLAGIGAQRWRVGRGFSRLVLGLARNWANLCGACPHCFAADNPRRGIYCPYHWGTLHPNGFGRVEPTRRERQALRNRGRR